VAAPRKSPGGLTKVLFVRVDSELREKIERLRRSKSEALGVTLSQADVVRMLIREATRNPRGT